jgi:hypothetical protein
MQTPVSRTGGAPQGRVRLEISMTLVEKMAEIERLAGLTEVEYELERKKAAELLGMRVGALDAAIAKKRAKAQAQETGEASASLAPAPPSPWSEEVDGSVLLEEIYLFIGRFVAGTPNVLVALTLWVVFTYLLDIVEINPRLAITSPTKRCGKTLVLSLYIVAAGLPTAANRQRQFRSIVSRRRPGASHAADRRSRHDAAQLGARRGNSGHREFRPYA